MGRNLESLNYFEKRKRILLKKGHKEDDPIMMKLISNIAGRKSELERYEEALQDYHKLLSKKL